MLREILHFKDIFLSIADLNIKLITTSIKFIGKNQNIRPIKISDNEREEVREHENQCEASHDDEHPLDTTA